MVHQNPALLLTGEGKSAMFVASVLFLVALMGFSAAFIPVLRRQVWGRGIRLQKLGAEVGAKESTKADEVVDGKGMPSKSDFGAFFTKTVSESKKEMCLDEFVQYGPVKDLLSSGLVLQEDLNGLWISNVGDAAGLTADEAYEMLCMTMDLPDPDDLIFLKSSFLELSSGAEGRVTFMKFLGWTDMQDMINEEAITMEKITELWQEVAGDVNASLDRKGFYKINCLVDLYLDEDSGEDDEASVIGGEERMNEANDAPENVYTSSFDPRAVFDDESIAEIEEVFNKKAGPEGMVLREFLSWDEVKDIMADKLVGMDDVLTLWDSAADFCGKDTLDLDTFLRLNIALDYVLDAAEAVVERGDGATVRTESAAVDDAESFYRQEFKKIATNGVVTLEGLLSWGEIEDLLSDNAVTREQIAQMFNGMPKETAGETVGISLNSFLGFNGMLDVVLDAAVEVDGSAAAVTQAATPSILQEEESRPMPQARELSMEDLKELKDDAQTFGKNELEMMETLDQADAMLLSGSFGDFDTLIGDENDPRLQREELDDQLSNEKTEVILKELLDLARAQKRAGLDRPEEVEEGRLRNLVQALVDNAPKASRLSKEVVTKALNGEWKLLYTNSEMFDFYNGVSGFVNVIPSSSFDNLITKYKSDGYLSEARYVEKLITPLGDVDVTVFSNWEVQKEMSFMTNEESILLRAYANKVTAGPFEYEAQENWKSLRTMSMNEIVYIDNDVTVMRNCGALRIFFVYERV